MKEFSGNTEIVWEHWNTSHCSNCLYTAGLRKIWFSYILQKVMSLSEIIAAVQTLVIPYQI